MSTYFYISVTNGSPARVLVNQKSYGPQELLVGEAERLIVELRNAINAARRRNDPPHKFTDLT